MKALYSEGLRVYTTLNLSYQRWAEDALRTQLHVLDKGQGWRPGKPNLLESGLEIESLEEVVEATRGMTFEHRIEMPANNQLIVLRRAIDSAV